MTDAFTTLSIIRDEHRRLTAIVRSAEYLTLDAAHRNVAPDAELLGMIFDYIDSFPDRLHHPKEDEYLFDVLRRQTSELDEILDELQVEHIRGRALISKLRGLLVRCRAGGTAVAEELASAVAEYAAFHEKHVRKEEEVVLPMAERLISSADWRIASDVFGGPDQLRLAEEFRRLFQLIMRVAPPPVVRLLVSVDL